MTAKFNYSILNHTLNGILNFEKLNRDFYKLNLNEKLLAILPVNDNLLFEFEEPVNDIELLDQSLDGLVSNHDGQEISTAKILRYSPEGLDKPIYSLNFRKELNTRLHNSKHWVFGRLLCESFFPFGEDLRTPNEEDLIVKVFYDYEFSPITKETVYRLETIVWFDEDGEIVETKPQPKIYVGHEGMSEAETRRKNIINFLKHDLDSLSKGVGSSEAIQATQALIASIDPYIGLYIQYGSFALIDFIQVHDNILLDNLIAPGLTVRAHMIAKTDFLSAESQNENIYKGSFL
jgi:hypothetical protein